MSIDGTFQVQLDASDKMSGNRKIQVQLITS